MTGEIELNYSRLTEFASLPQRTKWLEEGQEVIEYKLDKFESEVNGQKEHTSKECSALRKDRTSLSLGVSVIGSQSSV